MKKLVLLILLLSSTPIFSATVNVNASMTEAQIQTAINGSASGDTVSFAAGTYNLPSNGSNSNGAALNLLAGRIYTGPTSGSPAHLVGTSVYPLAYFSGTSITIQYLVFDHGGLFLENFVASASINNNTFENIDCGTTASQTVGIFINGGLNNSNISYNTFTNLGQTCNAQFQNTQGAGGIQMYGFHNLTIAHNTFNTVYEGIAIVISNSDQFDGASGHILNNTFTGIHRMAIEMLGTPTNPSGLEVAYTNYSNALLPWAYTFGLSLTAGQNMIVHDNIINGNVQATGGNYVPYGVEIGGVNSSAYNNTIEGYWGWGFAIGTNGPINISNNNVCGPSMAAAPSSGSSPVSGNAAGFLSFEAAAGTGTFTGNATSSALTCAPPPPSGCTLVKDEPQYGYNTLPGSQRYLMVYETGCPSAPISNIVMNGTTSAGTVTFTVPDATIFTVGKTVTTQGFTVYPFNQFFEGAAFVITSASGTSVTATYNNAFAVAGSTAVTGATLIQSSYVNWGTTAGTLSCTTNCLPTTNLTTDSVAGNLSTVQPFTPYPDGGYTMTSTHQITVTATPIDNPSNSVSYVINQAAETTQVVITGAQYTQAYAGQYRQLWSSVQGNVDQRVTWSITTQPSGGNATLSNTSKRNTLFKATVAGRYKITATSVDDPTKSAYEIIDVTATTLPSYASAPPDKAGPQACFAAPGLTGTVYEVGPSQPTYHALNDVPWRTVPQGSIIRLHNEDTTGSAPTAYHEYLQLPAIYTADQPLQICGVPDSLGHLPVMDGDQAHGPTWYSNIFLYGAGMMVLNPTTSCVVSHDPSGSCGPSHIRIAGIKIIHANPSYNFFQTDGVTTSPWGADAIDVRTGAYISVEGVVCDTTSQCVGTYANQNGNFPALSQALLWQEGYTVNNGISGNAQSHPGYLQSINGNVMDRVYVDTPITGDQGSCIKTRGQSNIIANSYCGTGFSRGIDFIEAQDDSSYIDFTQAMFQGGLYNLGGFDLNLEAARQESNFKDFVFGTVLKSNNSHYLIDHDDQLGDVGMNGRYGNLYFFYNTSVDPGILIDTGNQYNLNYFLNEKINIANSILWQSTGSWAINDFAMTAFNMQTNVVNSASMDNTTPIWGTPQVFGASGWLGKTQENTYAMARPLETHITGSLTTDFIKTATTPYNTPSLAPPSGSAAIGAATTLTGDMASFELTYNAMSVPGIYTRRVDQTTAGALDPAAPATPISIAVTPNPFTLKTLKSTTLVCTTTLSDASTRSCFAPSCTSTNTASATVSGLVVTATSVTGTGAISCTAESLTAPNDSFTITPGPPVMKPGSVFGQGLFFGTGNIH